MQSRSTVLSGERPLSVPQTGDSDAAAAPSDGVIPQAEFLRREALRIDEELFLKRFANWRVSLAGYVGIVWTVALLYRHIEPASRALIWALLETLVLAMIGVMCRVYERRRPVDLASRAQRRWLHAWTLSSATVGAITGLLPWFLPAGRIELQFSTAALVSILMIAFVVSRASRQLILATVGTYALTLCLSLAVHARMPWAVPVCLLFTVMLLGMGLLLNVSLRQAIGEHLYARYLHGELRRSHARQLQVQQREAAAGERERMMADLHDGFGAQLLTSLRLLESGRSDVAGAARALRECMEDLRLTVDAHEPAARNVATLLGMLRYRMQPRLQAAGVQLLWRIEGFIDADQLPATQSLDLLRILQQAIANAIQHAEAAQIALVVRREPRRLEVAVEDDGRGFDPACAPQLGRGIEGMRRRAARLGAELVIEQCAQGGTAVRLLLDLPLGSRGLT